VASAKEIRGQIKAIQNTAKITKAMEMVAASKMRKAEEGVMASRAYAEGIARVIGNLMQAHPEYRHPFIVSRESVKRVGLIMVSTDKGLCGPLNTNAFKATITLIKDKDLPFEAFTIGRRAGMFMRRISGDVKGLAENIPDTPELKDILGVVTLAMERYLAGEIDELHLVFNQFVNTLTQTPTTVQLLPCPDPAEIKHPGYWDYIYEPDSREVLDQLMRRYIESLVFHGVLENKACEQSARMVAMKSATDNAKEIVNDLRITYNKARQAAITQELAEICAGASAAQ
jgi:F-type H+-transporting ATPase subunit gamma